MSMANLRRRASFVRRMGSRLTRLVSEFDGDETQIRAAMEERYGSWALWLQLAIQLLPILLELFKALQAEDREEKFEWLSRRQVANLSMVAMHKGEAFVHAIEDLKADGSKSEVEFLWTLYDILEGLSEKEEISEPQ